MPGAFPRALRGHALFRFIALFLGFGFQVIVVKILSPENYATYAVLLATLLVGERLLSFGTDRTVLRFVPSLLLRNDRTGIRRLATRLALVRATGFTIFFLALATGSAVHLHVIPGGLSRAMPVVFGAWFIMYTLVKEADAVAQSLIIHQWAAFMAACEVLLRLGILVGLYAVYHTVDVLAVIAIYALTSSASVAGLLYCIARSVRGAHRGSPGLVPDAAGGVDPTSRHVPAFAGAAYASTLSYLISSPGVIRLVARAGLGMYELAAFSFVQGLSTSLSSALPGQLIVPSLEAVAATMAASGGRARVFPVLSVLFKIELTCVLSIIVASTIAGPQLIRMLSRPAYAAYWYILPALTVALCCQTVYRLIEILGSMHLKYRIFLTMWPLSLASMVVLYLTVGRWGLLSVLVVPLVEIATRVGILSLAFREQGMWRALDPARSLRLVVSAVIVLSGSLYVLATYGAGLDRARLAVAAGAVLGFLSTLLVVRPITTLEHDTLCSILPSSWTVPRVLARRLTRG